MTGAVIWKSCSWASKSDRRLPPLNILIINPDDHRVQLHERDGAGSPRLRLFDRPYDIIDLPDISVTLGLADIFRGSSPDPRALTAPA